MNIPCDRRIDCPGDDSPIRNYSAEGPDSRLFCEMGFYAGIPRIGECWERTGCAQLACSLVSTADAELQAYNASLDCTISTWSTPSCPPADPGIPPVIPTPETPPRDPVLLYRNFEQTCTKYCDSGEPVSYTVPAGTYLARSQLEADTEASTEACVRAQELLNQSDCMGCCDQVAEILSILQGSGAGAPVFFGTFPLGEESSVYQGQVLVRGSLPMTFSIVSGSLPTGTYLNTSTGLISGSPIGGNYTFTLKAENLYGSTTQEFSIAIVGLVPLFSSVPDNISSGYPAGVCIQVDQGSPDCTFFYANNSYPTPNPVVHTIASIGPQGDYPSSYEGTPPITYSFEHISGFPSKTTIVPSGMSIDPNTGYWTGSPNAPIEGDGLYYVNMVATNSWGTCKVPTVLYQAS